MPESKRPLKVFLCHAHIIPLRDADREAVRALYTRLTKNAILDRRVLTKQYGRLFLESLPQCTARQGALSQLSREAGKWLEQTNLH